MKRDLSVTTEVFLAFSLWDRLCSAWSILIFDWANLTFSCFESHI